MRKRTLFYLSGLIVCISACLTDGTRDGKSSASPGESDERISSPALSPEESLQRMRTEKGFTVELVAAEPLVVAPVALAFDERSRIWAVEMQGYMPDTSGTGEELPVGRVVILEDTNRDGRADTRKLFLDSLVLPRAILLIDNGVLVAEPPKLWFVERQGDSAGKKILVDGTYAEGGNVEHQPNGLLRNIDNWIYNAKSAYRYQKRGDNWIKEKTHFRGQWGISADDYGRLYYNHNSANVLGDYFFPSLGSDNSHQKNISGFNEKIVADNRVYPIRATTGINRGYLDGMLDSAHRLIHFTAACGPLVYRGHLFDAVYYGNAFVPEPSANLIKRNILTEEGYRITGRQAYAGKEFLASTDERFRPVNVYNAPDGALYVADMYRGIIQHKTYLTDYLKSQIRERSLEQPLSCGRIYRIVPSEKKPVPVILPEEPPKLTGLYTHPNGWVRDKAQQLITDRRYREVTPLLREYLQKGDQPLAALHALWTLHSLGELLPEDLLPLLEHDDRQVRIGALHVLREAMGKTTYKRYLPSLHRLLLQDSLAAPVVVYLVNTVAAFDREAAGQLLADAVKTYPDNPYVADAVISNLQGKEAAFRNQAATIHADTGLVIYRKLNSVLQDIEQARQGAALRELVKKYPRGAELYQSVCQNCHGADGGGLPGLAPPLKRSEWVTGSSDRLAAIVLYGLSGPVIVDDKLYKTPDINADMPGIAANDDLADTEIAQLLNFIRNAWGNKAGKISSGQVTAMRKKYAGREKPFTVEELNALP